jgi:TonB family protein
MIGSAAEHRVWVIVLFLQTLLPACSTLPPGWLSALFAWGGAAHRVGEANVSVVMGAGAGMGAFDLPAGLLTTIAIAYGAVSAYFAMRFLWRWTRLCGIRREGVQLVLTGEAAYDWEQCARRFGIEGVSIAASSRIFGPITMGLRRKLVMLPADMVAGLPEVDLHTVIAHEFAHIHRNDFLKNLIYEVLSLPVSYHPLFRFTRERIMESREIVCDEMAAETAGRNAYARSLLRLASLLVTGMSIRTPHAIGIFDANVFERRLMRLTGKHNSVRGVRRLGIVIACAALGVGTCGTVLALSMRVNTDSAASDEKSSKTTEPLKVSAEEMAGNVVHKVPPIYPVEAKKEKIQGTVVLEAIIGKDGAVENLEAISGPKELQKSSLDAVRQWTYKPFLVNGDPVEVKTTINVIYTLAK